jgi:hypothetical protein
MSNGTSAPAKHHDHGPFDWRRWLASQGVMAVFLAAMAYGVFFYMVVPMRDQQQKYIDSMILTNKQNADSFGQLVTSHKDASSKLDNLVQISKESSGKLDGILRSQEQVLPTLQQMRDDQRRGAWNDHPPKSAAN